MKYHLWLPAWSCIAIVEASSLWWCLPADGKALFKYRSRYRCLGNPWHCPQCEACGASQPTLSRLELSFAGKPGMEMPGMGLCSPTYTGSHSHIPPTCRVRDWISSLPQGNHKSPLPGPFSLHPEWPLAKEVGSGKFYAKHPKCFHFARAGWAHFPDNCF